MQILSHQQRQPARWKNGLGVTWQVAIFPATATLDNFDWRFSLAEVSRADPFSLYPGISRSLLLVEGATLDVTVSGVVHRLTPASGPLVFAGHEPASGLPDGKVLDGGVMSRDSRCRHRLQQFWLQDSGELNCDGDDCLLLNATENSELVLQLEGRNVTLTYLDGLWLEAEDNRKPRYVITPGQKVRLLQAEFFRVC